VLWYFVVPPLFNTRLCLYVFLFQSECENLKGQLSALSEKYNALAMRHMQYKSKRKAQVEDLRYIMLHSPFISTGLLGS
jgi:hypothetical protein